MQATTLRTRRGAAMVVAVLLLVMINITIAGAVTAGADDARISALRVQSLRARLAGESAAFVAAKGTEMGFALPGTTTLPGNERMSIVSVADPGVEGPGTMDVSVSGRFGQARRDQTALVRK